MSVVVDRLASVIASTELGKAVSDQHIAPLATEVARAVLTALREPSPAMVEAMAVVISGVANPIEPYHDDATETWIAAIDAALSEATPSAEGERFNGR